MAETPLVTRRRWLVPEVVQSSAMDCGPASLKALLEGYQIRTSYGRLREACQIDVDGTSIDTLEEVARDLGLEAEQVLVPPEHLFAPEARSLPALVVVVLPIGLTHFLVVWRTAGGLVQLMDPATGRRWTTRRRFLDDLYLHSVAVPAGEWRAWAESEEFTAPLAGRLRRLGVGKGARRSLLEEAVATPGWRGPAALDAATRLAAKLRSSGALSGGRGAAALVRRLAGAGSREIAGGSTAIPEAFWSVRPIDGGSQGGDGTELLYRGAVLVRIRGRRDESSAAEAEAGPARALSPELQAALTEPTPRPLQILGRLIRAGGRWAPIALILGLVLAAGGVVFEAMLFRGFFDIGRELGTIAQRVGGVTVLGAFLVALLLLDLPLTSGMLRLGRHLEARLRVAFLEKLPFLGDRYFRSRLTSDMAERCHSVYRLRAVVQAGGMVLRACFELLITSAAIIWLDPGSAPLALTTAGAGLLLPLLVVPVLQERDLKLRNHVGALARFYLDALLGLVPVRTHSAEEAVRREHEGLVTEWVRAHLARERLVVVLEALVLPVLLGLVALMLAGHLRRSGLEGSVLLLVFWGLNIYALSTVIRQVLSQQYPTLRSITLRLLEPLGAPSESRPVVSAPVGDRPEASGPGTGIALSFEGVGVHAGGHTILHDIDLEMPAGSHVAVVGPSGAGKTTLAGTLLGWHRPATGRILVDGEPLSPERLERLRAETAWVDPDVQLWNRSLLRNLRYGREEAGSEEVGRAIRQADLVEVLEALPDGLQSSLGEGGGLLSGGEGQRVRLGRALLRRGSRLVVLDEPFRGLDRPKRRELLQRAREMWRGVTLLCITHDLWETTQFDRVAVMEGGKIVELGRPENLVADPGSRFGRLLQAETEVVQSLWNRPGWKRLRLEGRRLAPTRGGGGAA